VVSSPSTGEFLYCNERSICCKNIGLRLKVMVSSPSTGKFKYWCLESFESDGSRWLCKNIFARTQIILYDHVGEKRKNLFFILWYKGAILLAEM
jgi:hypothetical protein